jgi:deoxyadenosine/deoxycytidine kinase
VLIPLRQPESSGFSPGNGFQLQGSDDLILERIRKRNRTMEQKSDADYYKSVNQAYERIFAHPASNVIVLEAGKFDSLNPKDIATLSATIDAFQP